MSFNEIPAGAVFLFGFFDGVHLGHKALFDEAARIAGNNRKIVVWTFLSMPKVPQRALITTNEEKSSLFSSLGADRVIFEDFSRLSKLNGRDFFFQEIAQKYHPYAVICGFNFKFGKNASCGCAEFSDFAAESGIKCVVLPPFEESGKVVSSTAIRNFIAAGDMHSAAEYLGRPYSVTLPVTHGKMLGRTIGHPTINQVFGEEKIIPPNGVYSCVVEFTENGEKTTKFGVCNIGYRPTVNSNRNDITLETNIFDFSGDLYGKMIKTSFIEKLRDEKKFASVEELSAQIMCDTENAKLSLEKFENKSNIL